MVTGANSINSLKALRVHVIKATHRPVYRHLFYLYAGIKCIVLGLALFSAGFVPPGNTNTDLVLQRHTASSVVDGYLKQFLTPFVRWDAVHMLAIARHGYVFENQFAFMPLLPTVARAAAEAARALGAGRWLSLETLIGLSGLLFTNSCHYLAGLLLFLHTRQIFSCDRFALLTASLFFCNAASIQLTAFYSEAPFALLSFLGLWALQRRWRLLAAVAWCLGGLARSNGILLTGFFVYAFLQDHRHATWRRWLREGVVTVLCCAVSVAGFFGFVSVYASLCFCWAPAAEPRPWCPRGPFQIGNIYPFVQSHYWNVGLFRYFTAAQIPNFLIAAPMIACSLAAIYLYFEADPGRFLSGNGIILRTMMPSRRDGPAEAPAQKPPASKFLQNSAVLPHIYLLAFMLLYTICIAHVQIITRIFTFQPVVYWFIAHLMLSGSRARGRALQTAIGVYGCLGTVLFACHYPPA